MSINHMKTTTILGVEGALSVLRRRHGPGSGRGRRGGEGEGEVRGRVRYGQRRTRHL